MNKLSRLQKNILSMAKLQGHVSNADILAAVYGFEQKVFIRVIRFERHRIGKTLYLSASAAVSKAIKWTTAPGVACLAPNYRSLC